MRRILVYDRCDAPLFELAPGEVRKCVRTEEINGAHSLDITTSQTLAQGQRVLMCDDTGKWREYVVVGHDARHESGETPFGEYYCEWSLKVDLMGTYVSRMPGVGNPVLAGVALEAALSGTKRWEVGSVTCVSYGGASMYDRSGWDAISTLVETWGGEIDPRITVDSLGVVNRQVDYFDKMGSQTPSRRYDFGADIKSVRRTIPDGPLYCRISPRGKGEETENGGYGRKIRISDVNSGRDYLENSAMVNLARLPDGSGGWEYPTLIVENSECETPADLKAWGQSVVEDYTVPQITYEVDVIQAASEGIDFSGVALGDATQVVDGKFDNLRVQGRIVKMVVDELSGTDVKVTLGYLSRGMAGLFGELGKATAMIKQTVQEMNGGSMSTAGYLHNLLARLNSEINANGGYTYILNESGGGIRTYDRVVSDPESGADAQQATEIKGGSIRIADSKTSSGDWDWKTLIRSGHILADLITAAKLVSGYIGSAESGNYWNLDTGEFRMAASTASVDGKTLAEYVGDNVTLTQDEVFNALTNNGALEGLYMSEGKLYVNATYIKSGHILADLIQGGTLILGGANNANGAMTVKDASGNDIVTVDKDGIYSLGAIVMAMDGYTSRAKHYAKMGSFDYYSTLGSLRTGKGLRIFSAGESSGDNELNLMGRTYDYGGEAMVSSPGELEIAGNTSSRVQGYIHFSNGRTKIGARDYSSSSQSNMYLTIQPTRLTGDSSNNNAFSPTWLSVTSSYSGSNSITFAVSAATVTGTKSRLVETDNYGNRLLYCYETPAPLFGDVGSGRIGDDGFCYVEIDDVFSESARTDMAYQVFLQKCGQGDLWVSEKTPRYFTVAGTPGLAFDWEIKAHQIDFEALRNEQHGLRDDLEEVGTAGIVFPDYADYVSEIEALYASEWEEA